MKALSSIDQKIILNRSIQKRMFSDDRKGVKINYLTAHHITDQNHSSSIEKNHGKNFDNWYNENGI